MGRNNETLVSVALVGLAACAQLAPGPELPTELAFDVHFAVLTRNPEAVAHATPEALRREVELLNERFVTAEGERIVTFRFGSAATRAELDGLDCALVRAADAEVDVLADGFWRFAEAYSGCEHAFGLDHVCDPGADDETSTNIMSPFRDCPGSTDGKRDLGFDRRQVWTIVENARDIHAKLNES